MNALSPNNLQGFTVDLSTFITSNVYSTITDTNPCFNRECLSHYPVIKGTCKTGDSVSIKVEGDYNSAQDNLSGDFNDQVYLNIVNDPCVGGVYAYPVTSFMLKRGFLGNGTANQSYPYRIKASIVDPLDPGVNARTELGFLVNTITNTKINPLTLTSNPTPTFTGTCTITGRPLIFSITIPPATTPQEVNTAQTCVTSGNWSFTPTTPIPVGPFRIKAEAIDPLGYPYSAEDIKSGVRSPNYVSVNLPTTATPAVTYPNLTNSNTPLIFGNCEPGSVLNFVISPTNQTLTINCPSVALNYGTYSFSTATIPDGSYSVTINATGGADGPITVTSPTGIVDTVVSPRTLTSTPVLNRDNTPTFTGTCEAGSTLVFTKNTAPASIGPNIVCPGLAGQVTPTAGTFSFDSTAIADGDYTATMTSTDVAGNVGTATFSGTIDTSTIATLNLQTTGTLANASKNNKPITSGTCETGSSLVLTFQSPALPAAATSTETVNTTCASGNYSVTPLNTIPDGTYSVSMAVIDLATNTFAISKNGTIDTVNLVTISVPPVYSSVNQTYSVNCEPFSNVFFTLLPSGFTGSATCLANGTLGNTGSWGNGGFGPALVDGTSYTLSVVSTDQAGNVSSASGSGTVDRGTNVTVVVDNITNLATTNAITKSLSNTTPTFSGTCELGATVALKVYDLYYLLNLGRDNNSIRSQGTATCVSGGSGLPGTGVYVTTLTAGLLNQLYIVEAIATDLNGNVSSTAVYGFRVDTTAPTVAFTVPNLTKNNLLPITGTCEVGSTVFVTINSSGSGSMGSTGFGSALTPPAAPTAPTTQSGTTVCSGTYPISGGVGNGTFSYTPTTAIADGSYSVSIYATDVATNTTSATPLVRTNGNVDITNFVTLVINPTNTINNNLISFSGTCEPGGTLPTNGLGGGTGGSAMNPANVNLVIAPTGQNVNVVCSATGTWSFTPPTTGVNALINTNYSVSITATDAAGNIALVSGSDSTKFISITSPALTNDNTPAVTGTCFAGSNLSFLATPNLPAGSGASAQVVTPGSVTTPQTFSMVCPAVDNSATIGTNGYNNGATNGANSTYLISIPQAMPDGNYTVAVTSTLSGSPTATVKSAGRIDSIATITIGTAAVVSTSTPTIFGSCEAGSGLSFVINTGSSIITPTAINPNPSEIVNGVCSGSYGQGSPGTYTFNTTIPMANGFYTVQATSTDQLGNVKVITVTNVINSSVISTVLVPATGLGNQPAISGTCEPNSNLVIQILIGGSTSAIVNETRTLVCSPTGTYTFVPNNIIPDGTYTLKTLATSVVSGNSGVALGSGTIDTQTVVSIAPSVAIPTYSTTPAITGSCENLASVSVTITQPAPGTSQTINGTCNGGNYSVVPVTPLVAGAFTLSITAKDIYYSPLRPTQNIATRSGGGTVLVNSNPVANSDTFTVLEDSNPTTPNTPANQFDILTNDTDIDGHTQITILGPTGGFTQPSHGAITLVGTGDIAKFYYTPTANYNGPDSFSYTITDGVVGTTNSTATVNITVSSVNDAPVANDDNQSSSPLIEDGANGVVNVLINDSDVDVSPTAPFNITTPVNVSTPALNNFTVDLDTTQAGLQDTITNTQGTWSLNFSNGEVTFDPANNFFGTATLTYELCDAGNPLGVNVLCDNAIITFDVTAVNDLPIGIDDAYTVDEDSLGTNPSNTLNVLSNDTDIDNAGNTNAGLTITNLTQPSNGTATIVNNRVIYVPIPNYNNTATTRDSFTYTASDGVGNSNVVNVSVEVLPVPDTTFVTVTVPPLTTDNTPPASGSCNPGDNLVLTFTPTNETLTLLCPSTGTYTTSPTNPIPDGNYCASVVATTGINIATANAGPACGIIDTTTYITITVPPTTTDNTPTVSGTCEPGGTVTISITVGTANTLNQTLAPFTCPNTGVYDVPTPNPIPDGPYCGQARIVDVASNTANAVVSCGIVDTTIPDTTIVLKPTNPTNQTTGIFTFTSTKPIGGTFECRLDNSITAPISFTSCINPQTYTGLSDGSHTFEVRAIDSLGNIDPTPAIYTWIVDTSTSVTISVPSLTNSHFPPATGNCEAGASLTINIGASTNLTSFNTTPEILTLTCPSNGAYLVTPTISIPNGTYLANVVTVDLAGNSANATDNGVIDDAINLTVSVPPLTNNPKPPVTGECKPGATVSINITTGSSNTFNQTIPSFTCSSTGPSTGTYSVLPTNNIPDGLYCANASSIDGVGNSVGPVVSCGIIDTTTYITITIPPISNTPKPLITGTCEAGGTVTLSITVGINNTPNQTLPTFTCSSTGTSTGTYSVPPTIDIPDGPYCANGNVVDPAGNTANAAPSCGIIDTTTYITVTVPPTTTDPTPNISGTCEAGGTVTISITVGTANTLNQTLAPFTCLNTGVYTTVVTNPIPDGPYCGQAQIVDVAGNTANAVASCGNKITPTGTVTGVIGDPFPPIIISNNPVPSCPTATFQGLGSLVMITGSIVNGNFVPSLPTIPNALQIIPLDSTLGNSTGVIKIPGCGVDINVITVFSPPPVVSASSSSVAVASSSIASSLVASSSVSPSSTSSSSSSTAPGGTITINPASSSSATPITPKPIVLKVPKNPKININDPYLCNDDIYGSIDTEDNSKALVTITLTTEGAKDDKGKLVFNPQIDKDGNYRIKIDHTNTNSRYYVPDGVYTVSYSVRLKGIDGYVNGSTQGGTNTDQYLEGKPYQAYIINPDKCNPITVPFTTIELPRTGGIAAGQFGIIVMLIIGMVWIGEGKGKSKRKSK